MTSDPKGCRHLALFGSRLLEQPPAFIPLALSVESQIAIRRKIRNCQGILDSSSLCTL